MAAFNRSIYYWSHIILLYSEENIMNVKEFIAKICTFDDKLQVAIFNDEFLCHTSDIEIELARKEDDVNICDTRLSNIFVSIREK